MSQRHIALSMCILLVVLVLIPGQIKAATPVTISLAYSNQRIPASSQVGSALVVSGQVLYRVEVKATVVGGGSGIVGKSLNWSNPATSTVRLVSNTTINSMGEASAYYEVRGSRSITVTAGINDGTYSGTATITFTNPVRAWYTSTFRLTYYLKANEADYTGSYDTLMPGVSATEKFKKAFVDAVRVNGSGLAHTGQYIQYNATTAQFYVTDVVRTASNTEPMVNKTIAVWKGNIPLEPVSGTWQRAKVWIDYIDEYRQAEDYGGAINGWKIDVYIGFGLSSILPEYESWNNTYRAVEYHGNNIW